MSDDLVSLGARELVALLKQRRCSAREVLGAHLSHIHRHNGSVRAVMTLDEEGALRRARDADEATARGEAVGSLHGLPMTVKDVYDTAGMRTTSGMPYLAWNRPSGDALLVGALRRAGAIVFGKTNLPLASFDWQTVSPLAGRTSNPWSLDRTVGGSSGGSAAALAAGFSPLEMGSDVAGSIRVPCHYCGVAGLRPSAGYLDSAGTMRMPGLPAIDMPLVVCGPMARDVGDLRLLLDALKPGEGVLDAVAPARPRLAFCRAFPGAPTCRATARIVDAALARLHDAGWQLDEVFPPWFDLEEASMVWGRIQGFEFVRSSPIGVPRAVRRAVAMPLFRAIFGDGLLSQGLATGLGGDMGDYQRALARREELRQRWAEFMAGYDGWLTPTSATVAFPHCATGSELPLDGHSIPYDAANGPYNCPTALLGHPIAALPAGLTPAGLPVGLQLHGRAASDASLLALAEALEGCLGRLPPSPLRG